MDKSCEDRVKENLAGRLEDISKMWKAYQETEDGYTNDGENLNEFGLSFDYVEPGTFRGQRRGYFRYQLSTGGPGDEFRFYAHQEREPGRPWRWVVDRIEYWFLDWWDGAKRNMTGKGKQLMVEIFNWLVEGFDDGQVERW